MVLSIQNQMIWKVSVASSIFQQIFTPKLRIVVPNSKIFGEIPTKKYETILDYFGEQTHSTC